MREGTNKCCKYSLSSVARYATNYSAISDSEFEAVYHMLCWVHNSIFGRLRMLPGLKVWLTRTHLPLQ